MVTLTFFTLPDIHILIVTGNVIIGNKGNHF